MVPEKACHIPDMSSSLSWGCLMGVLWGGSGVMRRDPTINRHCCRETGRWEVGSPKLWRPFLCLEQRVDIPSAGGSGTAAGST